MARFRILAGATLLCLSLVVSGPSVTAGGQSSHNSISRVEVTEGANQTIIELVATSRPTFTVFKLADPPRLFIDVVGAKVSTLKPTIRVANGVVGRIHVLQYEGDVGPVGRFVVEFDEEASYDIKTTGSSIRLFVDGVGRTNPDVRLKAAQVEARRLEQAPTARSAWC